MVLDWSVGSRILIAHVTSVHVRVLRSCASGAGTAVETKLNCVRGNKRHGHQRGRRGSR